MPSRRSTAVAAAVLLLGAFAPGVAHAAPPSNDDFDTPAAISALPFTATLTTTGATRTADDPGTCGYPAANSVWLRYTAPADAVVTLRTQSARFGPFFGVYTGTRGALTPVPGACGAYGTIDDTFHVEAGTTYHVMLAESAAGSGGPVTFDLRTVPASPNDDRANAPAAAIHTLYEGDLRRASAEPGEVTANCDASATQSVWYRFTPAVADHYSAKVSYGAISVHRASDLSEVDCLAFDTFYAYAMFAATPGESYLIRVASSEALAGPFDLELDTAGPLRPLVAAFPGNPTVHTDLTVFADSGIRRRPLTGTVDFGDGHSTPVTPGQPLKHRYAAEGEYTITVTGSTSDGRSGTGTTKVNVRP